MSLVRSGVTRENSAEATPERSSLFQRRRYRTDPHPNGATFPNLRRARFGHHLRPFSLSYASRLPLPGAAMTLNAILYEGRTNIRDGRY